MKKTLFSLGVFSMLLALSCSKKADFDYYYYSEEDTKTLEKYLKLPERPFPYTVELPQHLSSIGLFPRPSEFNKATLGRVLFYDKNLSKDGTVSCASCHKQEIAFSDDVAYSRGVYDRSTSRNSFALGSVANFSAYYGTDLNGSSAIRFFWDNRAETAADQSRGSLTNHLEMDMTMEQVVAAVTNQPYYEPLFKKAYGHFNVTEDIVLESIANFVNAMGSFNSKFDENANGNYPTYSGNAFVFTPFNGFSASEKRGMELYNANCASCHSGNMGRPVLNYANNGLDLSTEADQGVGAISGISYEMGTFKVPTLRNVALSAPYMHDGRFETLEEVIDHYSTGIKAHPNLSLDLKNSNGTPKQLNLTAQQKADMISFLHTLTDNEILQAEAFSDPFKH
ncbi:MAG: c-type cytochrome [Saprospiraceae bacterium]|nr:c-type cytochrome [Saprospiraceae bacterium]